MLPGLQEIWRQWERIVGSNGIECYFLATAIGSGESYSAGDDIEQTWWGLSGIENNRIFAIDTGGTLAEKLIKDWYGIHAIYYICKPAFYL